MLYQIKSYIILKKIFTYVDNKVKFNTIAYNKKLQRKLGLNLIDFRIFSSRYKEEKDGEIKEYNSYNHQTVFKGLYSNGKRSIEGEEYNKEGDCIFEREYLNGKKWNGICREYDEDTGNLIFECEYLNGIINGERKEYDKYNGDLLFSEKYLNGKRNGYGEEYK